MQEVRVDCVVDALGAAGVGRVAASVEGQEVAILEELLAQPALMRKIGRIFAETHESRIPSLRCRTQKLRELVEASWQGRVNLDWS